MNDHSLLSTCSNLVGLGLNYCAAFGSVKGLNDSELLRGALLYRNLSLEFGLHLLELRQHNIDRFDDLGWLGTYFIENRISKDSL